MNIDETRILITGAAGGIGSAAALELGHRGAKLLLTDIHAPPLEELAAKLREEAVDVDTIAANIASGEDRNEIVELARQARINTLINLAGVNPFGWLANQSQAEIELAFRINAVAPVLLCQAMLPVLAGNGPAHIVNVGSVFGAIGYPGFAAYSATKFALRGFSEALRRELADTNTRVHYVAPRATRTRLVTDRVRAMNEELKIAMDPPQTVARAIAASIQSERRELVVGLGERIFVKLNALFPGVIDRVLAKQLPIIRRYATTAAGSTPPAREPLAIHQPLQERTP